MVSGSLARLVAPRSVRRVWMISFELSPLVKVGGLGEAVRQQAEALTKRGVEVTVLMPSHGRHLDLGVRVRYGLRPLDFAICGDRRGVDGRQYSYCIGAEEAQLNGFRVVMFKGLDYSTGVVFDAWNPYSYAEEKSALLTRAVKAFSWHEVQPDLIHVHDWHSVLPGVALRDELEQRGYAVPLVFSIHLSGSPSFPWHYASPDWSGLDEDYHLVWRVIRHEPVSNRVLWDSLGGNVEAFGVHVADVVATVSLSYLRDELERKYGGWIEGKSCVVYNATDWDKDSVEKWILSNYGSLDSEVLYEIIDKYVVPGSWTGPLDSRDRAVFIASGRLTSQKGLDLAIRALDYAPSASLVILGIPVGDFGYEQYLRRLAEERRGRVLVTTNRIPDDVYRALVRLATSVVVPSRWEPFGLVALEALAVGTPVIASSVGGLKEIVVDIRSGEGDGLLVPPENPEALGLAMESFAHIFWFRDPHKVPLEELKAIALRNPTLPNDVRAFAVSDVNKRFRKESIGDSLMACYEKARVMAYYRAITR
ncbi:MAG: glycogen/starch synthase [Acidilobus sp.]